MKTLHYFSILVFCIFLTISVYSQQAFKYQAIIRNSTGIIVANQSVRLRVSLIQGSATGNMVFSENHTTISNNFGLVNLEIGHGSNISGSFSLIDWSNGSYFIKIELDITGNSAFVEMGTTQLLSVPFALYALTGNLGPQGLPGLDGVNGLDGANGIDGAAGPQGLQGPQGIQGYTGLQGLQGLTGQQGPPGVDGSDGIDGAVGSQGPPGVDGSNGIDGATGPQGLQGLTGIQGPPGVDGINGIDGINGAAGLQGPIGLPGPQGAAGTSVLLKGSVQTFIELPVGALAGDLYVVLADGNAYVSDGMNNWANVGHIQGPAGTNGIDGIDGAIGPQGDVGPQGSIGLTGQEGPQGLAGIDGVNGVDGVDGIDGIDGAIGPQGPIGLTGLEGPQGLAGIDGANGADGATGPQGLTGPAGADGTSVVLKGSVLTIAELPTASIAGDLYVVLADGNGYVSDGLGNWANVGPIQGPPGIDGINGIDGADGVNGMDGNDGPQGPAGLQGPIGQTGATGPQGLQGIQGEIGPQGPAGVNGTSGVDGIQGIQGEAGPQGIQGPIGLTGSQGPIGLTGPIGPQGIQGVAGSTGSTGATGPAGIYTMGNGLSLNGSILNSTWTSSGNNIFNNNSGLVGIGTVNPTSQLHLNGSFRITDDSEGLGKVLTSDASGNASWQAPAGNTFAGDTNYIPKFNANSNLGNSLIYQKGNRLGIGTTTPSGRVMIQADANASDNIPLFEIKDKFGKSVMIVYPDSVHFYVNDDPAKANNKGSFAVSGKSTAKSITHNLLLINPDSTRIYTNNPKAGFSVEDITGSASYMKLTPANYFIGHEAGKSIQSGKFNSFLGYQAGKSDTSGGYNVFLGYQAGFNTLGGDSNAPSAGSYNIFIGYQAGFLNQQGWYNTATGYQSLYSNTFGSSNVAYGYQSLLSNTSGGSNTAIGVLSLRFNTSGLGNTAIGSASLEENADGCNNTATGQSSLGFNINGWSNTANGYYSLYHITGNNNTGLGYECGYNATGSGNVFLGYMSGFNETGSNKLYISNTNTVTPLIYGEFDNSILRLNGKVGIGTTPTAKLDVLGDVKIVDGTQGIGKVLTSDATGLASWQAGFSGTGTTNYIAKFTGTTAVGNSILFDNGTNIGIGLNNPVAKLEVLVTGNDGNAGIAINKTGGKRLTINQGTTGMLNFTEPGVSDLMTLNFNTKNVGIGSVSPTHKLEVIDVTPSSDIPAFHVAHNVTDNYGVGIYANGGYKSVVAENTSNSGYNYGVYTGATGIGGITNYGIYSEASGATTNYAGYFQGNVHVNGTLSKSAGTFKIDHPMDPENKYLIHSFVESPDMKNVYDGVVVLDKQGQAEVKLPEYFSVLNKDFRYQLTPIGGSAPNLYIAQEVLNNQFIISGGSSGLKVSWQVTGIRQDPYALKNPIIVEQEKSTNDKGKYLNPELYKVGKEKAIGKSDNKLKK